MKNTTRIQQRTYIHTYTHRPRAGFCRWGPGANIEDGSSLIIHWSSGSHKRSTNRDNQCDIYFGGGPYWWGARGHGPLDEAGFSPLNPALHRLHKIQNSIVNIIIIIQLKTGHSIQCITYSGHSIAFLHF